MASRLIELGDGVLVEVKAADNAPQEISTFGAERVSETFNRAEAVLRKIIPSVANALVNARDEMAKPIALESAELEVAFAFTTEGSAYIVKGSAEASLKLTVKFKAVAPTQSASS